MLDSSTPREFTIVFDIIIVFGAVVFVLVIAGFVRAFLAQRKMKAMGIDPYTVEAVAIHNVGEAAARSARSPEERLRELDGLRNQGLLTAEEYDAKRREIINDL